MSTRAPTITAADYKTIVCYKKDGMGKTLRWSTDLLLRPAVMERFMRAMGPDAIKVIRVYVKHGS